jgi:vacuolar-type H+-ATPase subunit E/Vma4
MEELQSTEILAREILEDARKKAARTLKAADDTVRAHTREWEKKTAENIAALEKKYGEQKELAAEKIMARLPIDKRRAKVEKIENLLESAVESWYNSLSRDQILELLSKELEKRLALCDEFSASSEKRVFYHGLERGEVEKTLKILSGNCIIEESATTDRYPAITLEAGNVRIIASIQMLVDFLLQEKRIELVEALVGSAYTEET